VCVCYSFVRELHEQLVACMNHFTEKLQKFQSVQAAKINSCSDSLRQEITTAQQLVSDIEMMLLSPAFVSAGGLDMVRRCEEFFETCTDYSHCSNDFAYVDFIPAGRLYVHSEHLGYLRLCDAAPDDIQLTQAAGSRATCNREFAVLIQTNHSQCIDAEPYLEVQLVDSTGDGLPTRIVNNNDGSYQVVFTPTKPGLHQLHVRLYGNTVNSSPLEISVSDEACKVLTPNPMPDARAWSVGNPGTPSTSFQHRSGKFEDSRPNASVKTLTVTENFDDVDYFSAASAMASLSPHTVAKNSPGSCSTGNRYVTAKQVKENSLSMINGERGHGDCEEIRGSLTKLSVDQSSPTGNKAAFSWQPSNNTSIPAGNIPSYASESLMGFDDLTYETYEPDDDLSSSGVNLQLLMPVTIRFSK